MNYSIYAESTPNPEVMKFVSNRLIADKSLEITSIKNAQGISIAEELLKFPFVKSIYLNANFISITKTKEITWEDIAMHLRTFIVEHLNNNGIKNYTEHISKKENKSTNNNKTKKKQFNKKEQAVDKLLNEYIKPAVEADGGSITLNYYKNNIVCVDLKGACSGCPSSSLTLKSGIESLLQQKIDSKIEVIANEK